MCFYVLSAQSAQYLIISTSIKEVQQLHEFYVYHLILQETKPTGGDSFTLLKFFLLFYYVYILYTKKQDNRLIERTDII